MKKTNFTKILMAVLIVGILSSCSSWKPLKAPCTYDKRSKCGPVIPLQ